MMKTVEIQEQIDGQICELLSDIPAMSSRILASLQLIKSQQEACSSTIVKEKLEQIFQLGGMLFANYSSMINKLPEYIKLTSEMHRMRADSLMSWGHSIKDMVEGVRSPDTGTGDELTAKLGKQQIELFAAMVKSYENSVIIEMVAELVIVTLIYLSLSTTDLILSIGQNSRCEPKKQSILEFVQAILGFAPIVGELLGVKDFFFALKSIEDAFCSDDALHSDLQTADQQFVQMELQCTKLQENLLLQKEIMAYLNDSVERAALPQ